MNTYSAFFTWPGGEDTATFSAQSDETALKWATEHARSPWRGWPPTNSGMPVDIDLAAQVQGGMRYLGCFEVAR